MPKKLQDIKPLQISKSHIIPERKSDAHSIPPIPYASTV